MIDRRHSTERSGLYFGQYVDSGEEIIYSRDAHCTIIGPTRVGKDSGIIIPNLLRNNLAWASIIDIDPKGEAYFTTARYQREVLKRNVVPIDPFNVLGEESEGFNPLDDLDPDDDLFYDECATLADALIPIKGNDPHWSESAQGCAQGTTMFECITARARRREPSLANVRVMMTQGEYKIRTDNGGEIPMGFSEIVKDMLRCEEWNEEISSLVGRFLKASDPDAREIHSILSNADTATRWLLSRKIRRSLEKKGFDFQTLRKTPTTVYIVLPANLLRVHGVWLRLVVATALKTLYRHVEGLPVWFFINETAALGRLAPLEDAMSLVTGYGVQILTVFQNMDLLNKTYPDAAESFLGNSVVACFRPGNSISTAKWMSERSGEAEIVEEVANRNIGAGGVSQGRSEHMRTQNHFRLKDIFGLPDREGILWPHGVSHGTRFRAPHYKDMECGENADPNPYDRKRF